MPDATEQHPAKPASENQLQFARNLGLVVDETMPGFRVRRLITNEVKRRGRLAIKKYNPHIYDVVLHPRLGKCEITRVGVQSLKITLQPFDGSKKIVIDAMRLEDYPIVRD